MTFENSLAGLIRLTLFRIRSGEFTVRGLARRLEISQSQLHNILAGNRGLTAGTADRLLAELDLNVADLLPAAPDLRQN